MSLFLKQTFLVFTFHCTRNKTDTYPHVQNTGRNTQRLETRGKRKMSRTFRHRERNNEETRFVNSRFAVVAPRGVGRAMFLAFENQERVCG